MKNLFNYKDLILIIFLLSLGVTWFWLPDEIHENKAVFWIFLIFAISALVTWGLDECGLLAKKRDKGHK